MESSSVEPWLAVLPQSVEWSCVRTKCVSSWSSSITFPSTPLPRNGQLWYLQARGYRVLKTSPRSPWAWTVWNTPPRFPVDVGATILSAILSTVFVIPLVTPSASWLFLLLKRWLLRHCLVSVGSCQVISNLTMSLHSVRHQIGLPTIGRLSMARAQISGTLIVSIFSLQLS